MVSRLSANECHLTIESHDVQSALQAELFVFLVYCCMNGFQCPSGNRTITIMDQPINDGGLRLVYKHITLENPKGRIIARVDARHTN